MKSIAAAIAFVLLVSLPCSAEERFGDFTKHKLTMKLEQHGSADQKLTEILSLPSFLILSDGYLAMSDDESEEPDEEQQKNRIEFYYHSFTAQGKSKPELEKANKVRFTIVGDLWNQNDVFYVVTIPFTIDNSKNTEMIQFSKEGTIEMFSRQAKGSTATILFNPMGWPLIVKQKVKCTVVESTLGFKNILK